MSRGGPATPRTVVTDDRPPSSDPAVDTAWLSALAGNALGALGITGPARLDITLVDVATISRLNREHLGGDGATDVLAFPLDGADPPAVHDPDGHGPVPWTLGDLIICPAVAAAQAPDHAGTFEDELALLCVHGILHVLGWDHGRVDQARAMRAEEARILELVHAPVAAGTEIPT